MGWRSSVAKGLARFLLALMVTLPVGLFDFSKAGAASVALRPPFNGTYRLTSFFDHYYPNANRTSPDNQVTIYTGEKTPDCRPHCYPGHGGIDWGMDDGTEILAATDGEVLETCWSGPFGYQVLIDHKNGYYTRYAHLRDHFNVAPGAWVQAGQLIGWSSDSGVPGQYHLHLSVYRGGHTSNNYVTDPFGWRGSGPDPLRDWPSPGQGRTAECLWRGLPGDPISCFDHIVEDHWVSENGWTQYGSNWHTSSQGNGFLEHHTCNWYQEMYWGQWDSRAGGFDPLPHRGFYRVSAFIPPIANRTTNAQYDIHYYPPPSVQTVNVNQRSAVAPSWYSLGSYEMEMNASYCYVRLDDYTGETNCSRDVAWDAVKFSAELTYLPKVHSSTTPGSWKSYLEIRNLSAAESARVSVNWYQPNGLRYRYDNYNIPARGRRTVDVPNGFDGAAVVVSDQDVAVVLRYERDNIVAAYTGVSEANVGTGWGQPGVDVYVPLVMWLPWDTWRTYLYVQNTGNGQATFSITYYDKAGNRRNDCSLTNQTLAVNASTYYQQNGCGTGFFGSARIVSDQPLAVVVLEQENTYGGSMYNAFSYGDTTIHLPSLMRTWYGWTSSFTVQNVGSEATDISVRYYGDDGRDYSCTLTNLPANASCVVVQDQSNPSTACPVAAGQSCAVGDNWHGTAILSASQPLVAIVNQQLHQSDYNNHQSYSGFVRSGGSIVYGPLAAYHGLAGGFYYDSCSDVQNVGAGAVTISTQGGYFRPDGTGVEGSGFSKNTDPDEVAVFYVPNESVPRGFFGSVRVTCAAGSAASGVHNLARLDSSGNPTLGDYGAGYNMPQR